MKKTKRMRMYLLIIAILGVFAIVGCSPAAVGGGDTTAPTVASTSPASTGAAMDGTITATFSEAMDPATIVAANFTVAQSGTLVPGAVTYDAATKSARFVPTPPYLSPNIGYDATITTGVKDVAGNPLAANKVWTFTTALGASPVPLRTAANYVILGDGAIANHTPTGPSVITGDVAINATSATLSGFNLVSAVDHWTSDQAIGWKLYSITDLSPAADAAIGQAVLDMQTAYSNAHSRPTANSSIATEIGGLSFVPGVYLWTGAVNIGTDVTITGGANDVWIFQTNGALGLSDLVKFTVTPPAQAKNVYWAVHGAVTLGANSQFNGILLGSAAVTLNSGATVKGRVLAGAVAGGALEMFSVTVTKP